MPFNIYKYMMKQFNDAEEKMKAQLASDPNSIDAQEYQDFNKVKSYLSSALLATETMGEGNKPLTKNEAVVAGNLFKEFLKQAEYYIEIPFLYRPNETIDLCNNIKACLNVVKEQANFLTEVSKLEEGADMPSMNDIFSNYEWLDHLFNEDPDVYKNKQEATKKWVGKDHSIAENMEKYRACYQDLHNGFFQHLINITGDREYPEASFAGKISLAQAVLDSNPDKEGRVINISQIVNLYSELLNRFNIDKLETLGTSTLITNDLLGRRFEGQFEVTSMSGFLAETSLSDVCKKSFEKLFKNLAIKPYNLGIDAEKMQALNESSTVFFAIDMVTGLLLSNYKKDYPGKPIDKNNPIYKPLELAKLINNKAVKFIKDEPGAKPVNDDEIKAFLQALGESAIMSPVFNEDGTINRNCNVGIDGIETIANNFPQFQETFGLYKYRSENKMERAAKALCDEIAKLNPDSDDFGKTIDKFNNMNRDHLVNNKMADRFMFMRMCKDEDYRTAMLESNNSKAIAMASVIQHQYDCVSSFAQSDRSLKSMIEKPYNRDIAKTFLIDKQMTDQDIYQAFAFCDALMANPVMKSYEKMKVEDLKQFSCGTTLFSKLPGVPSRLGGPVLDALIQESGNLNSSNSEEYEAIGKAIKTVAKEAHNIQGVSKEAYKSLYDACTKYMYTHDSKPVSTNGKLRFNAAATIMADLVPTMLKNYPEMWNEIERDVQINSIRSKHFRDIIAASNENPFKDMAGHVGKVLTEGMGKDMITGKLATEELQEGLVSKFKQQESAYNKKHFAQNRPAAEQNNPPKKDNSLHI